MIFALDGTVIIASLISMLGVVSVALFGYLGVRTQVKKSESAITDKVSELDNTNTYQHDENAKVLNKILETIAKHGVMISTMINNHNHPIIKTDSEGRVLKINPAGIHFLGMSLSEVSGSGWLKSIHPGDRASVHNTWINTIASGKTAGPVSYRHLHPHTKEEVLVETMLIPVINGENEKVVSWIISIVPVASLGVEKG